MLESDLDKLLGALEELQKQPIFIESDGSELFTILTQLQLALRHPGNKGETARIARNFAFKLQAIICDLNPNLQRLLDAGWHPECDVDPESEER